jgi:hypothetical protein
MENNSYSDEEKISEVAATLRLEGMDISESDLSMLCDIKSGKLTTEDARTQILSEA